MDFKETLAGLKKEIDKELELQFDSVIKDVRKEDVLITEALEQVKKITLAGGKRIRGALLCQAYFGAGGRDKKKIIKTAAAIELVHMFLLIHDDIIDRGNLRHGEETLHKMLSGKKQKYNLKNDGEHFGISEAIIAGDILYALANKIIIEAGFEPKISMRAISELQSVVANTVVGESQDILIAYKDNATEKEVLSMLKNKTAKYTFEGPLHIGAILGGCNNKKTLKLLSQYAIPVGIAFQIQDDILGVFGNEKTMGKSVASDIEEGKKTILVSKARELANSRQKKQLDSILGKKGLKNNEVRAFQDILKSTGSLEYSKKMAANYLAKGKREIKKMALFPETKKFLAGLVEYLENRET